MNFKYYQDFPRSLLSLKKKGGQYQRAATDIEALQGRIEMHVRALTTENPLVGLRYTKHGESRIRNCVKYDLSQFARLVTLQTDNCCVLLFAGTHDDTDRWLERNTGLEIVIDDSDRASVTFRATSNSDVLIGGERGAYPNPLFQLLTDEQYDLLTKEVPQRVVRELDRLYATFRDTELKQLLGVLSDRERARLIEDVFSLLRGDRVEQAGVRLRQFGQEVEPLESIDAARLPELIDGDILRGYEIDSPIFKAMLKRYAESASYRDWMLFMHPDQERVVNEDFDGPAKLVGVSGSGKTCVVV